MTNFTDKRFKKLAGLLNEQVTRKRKNLLSWVEENFNRPEQFVHALEDLLSRKELSQLKMRFSSRWGYESGLDESNTVFDEEDEEQTARPARSTTTKKVPSHIQARWDKRAKERDSVDEGKHLTENDKESLGLEERLEAAEKEIDRVDDVSYDECDLAYVDGWRDALKFIRNPEGESKWK